MQQPNQTTQASGNLIELAYELLDAHDDTARLARESVIDEEQWAAHLDYLRRLQRVGREVLAHVAPAG